MIFNMNSGVAKKCPVLDASYPANSTVVAGNNATFSVKIAEDGKPNVYTYRWYMDGTAVSSATAASYTANTSSLKGVYSIWCEVTNAAGTVTSKTATLTVNKTPVLSTSAPANAAVTSGTNATFSVVVGTAGYPASYAYQWYLNDSAVSGATGSSYTVDTSAMKGAYSVYCKVTNAAGTVQTRTATLTVNKTPVLNTSYPANAGEVNVCDSAAFSISISTDGFPVEYTYQWYLDGSAVSGATSASYTVKTTTSMSLGVHSVYCKVTNTAGTVTSRTATFTVVAYMYNYGEKCENYTGGWNSSGYGGAAGITDGGTYLQTQGIAGTGQGVVGHVNAVKPMTKTLKAVVSATINTAGQEWYLGVYSSKSSQMSGGIAYYRSTNGLANGTISISVNTSSNVYVALVALGNNRVQLHKLWWA